MDFWKDLKKKEDPLEPGSKADRIQQIIKKHENQKLAGTLQPPKSRKETSTSIGYKSKNSQVDPSLKKLKSPEDIQRQIDDIKREAANEIRNVKRDSRKRALEFFIDKTQDVINVFKEEQIHMVDAYYKMRKEDTKQQITIHNLKKQIND